MTLTITFALGTNLDTAQVQVQNRVAQALPRLPQEVQRIGAHDREGVARHHDGRPPRVARTSATTCCTCRTCALLQVKDELSRPRPAWATSTCSARASYACACGWIPEQAGRARADGHRRRRGHPRAERAGGGRRARRRRRRPTRRSSCSINAQGRLTTEEEFSRHRGARDRRRARSRALRGRGARGAGLQHLRTAQPARQQARRDDRHLRSAPGSNAIQASADVRALLEKPEEGLPGGRGLPIIYDPTVFVRDFDPAPSWSRCSRPSLLVVIVVLLFLQTWRASVIPLIAVPVSLVGTFAVMLALGLLAQHAVAVRPGAGDRHRGGRRHRGRRERGAPHRTTACRRATRPTRPWTKCRGPIIAIALVLAAVFIPTAFVSGLTGQFYRQFALTIAISTVISAFNSLTLSPALASRLLRPRGAKPDVVQRVAGPAVRPVLRLVQPRCSRARRAATCPACHAHAARERGGCDPSTAGCWRSTALGFSKVPQGFIPRRTRTTWWRSRSCPTPRRSIARTPWSGA